MLKNAIEAMPNGGIVRISIYRQNSNEINISITDQGEGIEPERIPYLGQPFYSLKEKGTGLGLMVCSKIVKEHRGEMEFHSELGKGTSVDITFPLTTAE
ncbi:ATP-binding protein [Ammoniphilus resinae]|uniref:ATP-binding protein n=1 Tax=Ammoniphilus resinae TaxID=861532 RepID=UPI001AE9E454|nr:ATP-binding protein [Ammoniphilus resinae]